MKSSSLIAKPNIDLLHTSIALVSNWLSKKWADYEDAGNLTVDLARAEEDARSLRRASEDETITYPYVLLTLVSLGPNSSLGPYSRKHIDIRTNIDTDVARLETFMPVNLGFGVTFKCTNIKDSLRFGSLLILNAPRLVFKLKSENDFLVEIGVSIDPELTIGPADFGTPAKHTSYNTTLIMNTYIGTVKDISTIKEIRTEVVHKSGVDRMVYSANDSSLDKLIDKTLKYSEIFDPQSDNYRTE